MGAYRDCGECSGRSDIDCASCHGRVGEEQEDADRSRQADEVHLFEIRSSTVDGATVDMLDYIGIGGPPPRGSLTVEEYDREAARTATYPGSGTGDLTYPILGLIGETGELAEHAKKMLRDDGGTLTPARRESMLKEAGDVLWYLSAVAREESWSLRGVIAREDFPLNPTDWSIGEIMRDLGRCVGRIAGGDFYAVADSTYHAGDVAIHNYRNRRTWILGAIWDLAALARALDSTLAEIAAMNAAKLRSRQERGVLGGSGSER